MTDQDTANKFYDLIAAMRYVGGSEDCAKYAINSNMTDVDGYYRGDSDTNSHDVVVAYININIYRSSGQIKNIDIRHNSMDYVRSRGNSI